MIFPSVPEDTKPFERFSRFQLLAFRLLNGATGFALICIVIGAILAPRVQEWVPPSISIPIWCVAGLVAIFAARKLLKESSWSRRRIHPWALGFTVALTTALIAIATGRSLAHDFGWDAGEVLRAATAISAGEELGDYPYGYFSRYPNNIPLVVLDRAIVWFSTQLGFGLGTTIAIFNGLAVLVISLAVFSLVRDLGNERAALFGQALVLVFLGFSPWLAVPYTDVPVAALIVSATALAVRASNRHHRSWNLIALLLASGVLAGFAVVLKPTAAILLIAMGLAAAVAPARGMRLRSLLRTVTVVGTALITAFAGGAVSPALSGLDLERIDSAQEFPMHHFARMGLIEAEGINGSVRYGGFDADSVKEMMEAESLADRKELSSDAILERLQDLGLDGYAAFLAKKGIWIWSDGTFGAWVEGSDDEATLFRDGPFSSGLQQILHPHGAYWKIWSTSITGLWLAVVFSLGVLLVRRSHSSAVIVLTLCVLGITAFSLLFEGRSRYLIIFLPTIIALLSTLMATGPSRHLPETTPGGSPRTVTA